MESFGADFGSCWAQVGPAPPYLLGHCLPSPSAQFHLNRPFWRHLGQSWNPFGLSWVHLGPSHEPPTVQNPKCLIGVGELLFFDRLGLISHVLTSFSLTWNQFGVILGLILSWASLGSLRAVLEPCWAISALSGSLLGQLFAISEPRSTLIGHSGHICGHLGTL